MTQSGLFRFDTDGVQYSLFSLHTAILPGASREAVLGPFSDWFQLNLTQAVRIHPGSLRQPRHRDEEMWPCNKSHEYLVNVMLALGDFTAENGATRIWSKTDCLPESRDMDES